MGSSLFQLVGHNDSTETSYSLATLNQNGASYLVGSQGISTPQSLTFEIKRGNLGSKANDRYIIEIAKTGVNDDTGNMYRGSVKIEISLPRDSEWIASGISTDLVAHAKALLSAAQNRNDIINGVIPTVDPGA